MKNGKWGWSLVTIAWALRPELRVFDDFTWGYRCIYNGIMYMHYFYRFLRTFFILANVVR